MAAAPGQRESTAAPASARWDSGEYPATPAEGSSSNTGLLIAVGIVVLLAVVGLTAFMWPRGDSGPGFAVNSCVKQSGNTAVPADCNSAGAFTIVSKVERSDQCTDRNQPYVELGTGRARILCLAPAGGAPVTGPSGGPTGATSATPNPGTT